MGAQRAQLVKLRNLPGHESAPAQPVTIITKGSK
jgi:hypothetical protein